MCLSDEKQENQSKKLSQLIPLLDHHQAYDAKQYIHALREDIGSNSAIYISVSTELLPKLGMDSFAIRMFDDSMMPEFRPNDVLVIDFSISPQPGNYVLVRIAEKAEVIVCQYKKLSYTAPEFELLTLNDNWPNIKVSDGVNVEIIGAVVEIIRGC